MDEFAQKQAAAYDKMAARYVEQKFAHNHAVPDLKIFRAYLGQRPRVLDLGCGGGNDAKFLVSEGCDVLGVDLSEAMIAEAKRRVGGAAFEVADFRSHEFPPESFDGVWCSTVFHHIPMADQKRFLEKVALVLKPGGVTYVSTKRSGSEGDSEGWVKEDFNPADAPNAGIAVERFVKKLSDASFRRLVEENGFEVLRFKVWGNGIWMDIFARTK
jgi:ubiquinone/menaquinone biosynthesis C-methylase UbiE